jgi:superfamily II DNA or RNA helicase
VASAIANDTIGSGGCVLALAHRQELVDQMSNKLFDLGIDAGILMPGHPHRPGEAAQIASIPTLHSRGVRGCSIDMPRADLIIVDEAHHIRARTYREIIARYPEAIILGVTATPCRGDNRGLGDDFDVLFEAPDVAELIELGHLVPAIVYAPVKPDLRGVTVHQGDYAPGELQERMNTKKLVGDIVEHGFKHADRRRTIAYATGVNHSVFIRDEFRRAGVIAEHIDGSTPSDERRQINCVGLDHSGAVFRHGPPNEPICWSLSPDEKMETATAKARAKHYAPALVTCPECSSIRFEGKPCPACGWAAETEGNRRRSRRW